MTPVATTYSVRDLQRNYRAIINDAKRTHDAVVIINSSKPEAVMLDIETYNVLAQDDYAWDEKRVLRLVQEARKSCKAGKRKRLNHVSDLDA